MNHPDPQIQQNQEEFLKRYPEDQREFHARLFRIGNATYRYHQLAASAGDIPESYFEEWLEGLPANIRKDMEKQGFEKCKSMLSFTRYVNECRDIGMDDWMKKHLSEEDYNVYSDKR